MQTFKLLCAVSVLGLLFVTGNADQLIIKTQGGNVSSTQNVVYTSTNKISQPAWSPDGSQIVFVSETRGGIIYKTNAAGERLGNPLQVYKPLIKNYFSISPDGSSIVCSDRYYDNNTKRYNIYLYSTTQDNYTLLNDCIPATASLFKWSNDSHVIYCYVNENSAHSIKAVTSEDQPVFSVLLDSTASFSDYSIAPDKQSIAWACKPPRAEFWQIWLYTPATGQRQIIAADSIDYFHPSWSPDGKSIACHAYNHKTSNRSMDIYSLEKHSSRSVVNNLGWFTWIKWADDGQTIYFAGYFRNDPQAGIWAVSLPDNHITIRYKSSLSAILQLNNDGSFYPGPRYQANDCLCTFSVADKKVTCLTQGIGGNILQPVWSPDGASLVFSQNKILYKIPATGGTPVSLNIPTPVAQLNPAFSPDGSLIVFDDGKTLYTVSSSGEHLKEINFPYQLRNPVWSPDGKQIACTTQRDAEINLIFYDYTDGQLYYNKAWPGYYEDYAWSDSHQSPGEHILLTRIVTPGKSRAGAILQVRNVQTGRYDTLIGEQGTLSSDTPNYISACWAPDGEKIAWIQNNPECYSLNIARVFTDIK